jgi:hypothetical protein
MIGMALVVTFYVIQAVCTGTRLELVPRTGPWLMLRTAF